MKILALKIVLVATDLRDASLPAIHAGCALAQASGGSLHVVHVGPSGSADASDGKATHAQLGRLGIPLDAAAVHTTTGDPAHAIATLAADISADVIVIGPHGTDEPAPLGTALAVATQACAPCLIIAQRPPLPLVRAIVAIDGSETAHGAMTIALAWASALRGSRVTSPHGATLVALFVDTGDCSNADRWTRRRALDEIVHEAQENAGTWAGVTVERVVVCEANVPLAIAKYVTAGAADLVVLGTRGLGLDDTGRIGSVAGAVTQLVTVPTLLVPPAISRHHTCADEAA